MKDEYITDFVAAELSDIFRQLTSKNKIKAIANVTNPADFSGNDFFDKVKSRNKYRGACCYKPLKESQKYLYIHYFGFNNIDTEIIGKEICEYLSKTNIKYEWSGNRASCIAIPINNNFDHIIRGDEMSKIIYVASAHGGKTANIKKNARYCREVIAEGHTPLSPHHIFSYLNEVTERNIALDRCIKLLKVCDEIWFYGKMTEGMIDEETQAKRLNKPIKYIK